MDIRLYLDEDSMDQRLVRALRARGMDVETALGAKRPSTPGVLWRRTWWLRRTRSTLHTRRPRDVCSIPSTWRTFTNCTVNSWRRVRDMLGSCWARSSDTRWASACESCFVSGPSGPLRICKIGFSFFPIRKDEDGSSENESCGSA